ncbi:MAG TPA: OsmC family peroxiredoxin [Ktedonobacterales bacterium]|jgi:osmotically inducible protein OsmC|nr:OsmC family peroxiredoxin [Ktedonobacterales bacterium]
MIQATQHASVNWDGSLGTGSGQLTFGDGAASDLPVSWASRTGHASGKTSPEELLAAAHASCYAMAFAHILEERGTPPQHLTVAADCTFEQVADGFKVSRVTLSVEGKVAGVTPEQFADAARAGERFCPISNALRGNVDITLTARLIPA